MPFPSGAHGTAVAPGKDLLPQLLGRIAAGETQRVRAAPDFDVTAGGVVRAARDRRHRGNLDAELRRAM